MGETSLSQKLARKLFSDKGLVNFDARTDLVLDIRAYCSFETQCLVTDITKPTPGL